MLGTVGCTLMLGTDYESATMRRNVVLVQTGNFIDLMISLIRNDRIFDEKYLVVVFADVGQDASIQL